jgi:hypothetical protein
MPRQQSYPIRAFQPVSALEDTVDKGVALEQAKNILLRPQGGWSGPPVYDNLWAIGIAATVQSIYRALIFSGTAIGDTAPRRATNKTVAIQIARQGKNFLLFYDLTADAESACRGWFYIGDDGSYTAGDYAFTTGTPTYTVLAVGLDAAARWHGYPNQGAWFLGNGVDDNAIVQLGRSATPGIWRKAGSNVTPAAPVVSVTTPASQTNVQAKVTFTRGGQSLEFTADPENYPGSAGNSKITIRLTAAGVPSLSSTLSGSGTTLNPYAYVVSVPTVTGTAAVYTPNSAIATFVNADSKAITLFAAAGANAGGDGSNYGPTAMSGGTGSGLSEGFSSRTVTVQARYWDPGHDGHGYEGPSSAISNTVIIPNTANNDISIAITPDPAAEGGRFPYIRLYMQFGEDGEAVWKLITPDSPVDNTTGVKTVTVGTNTLFGEDNMSANQNRPLPHKFHAFAAEQMWRGGLPDHPERLYASKIATVDEIAPEGCSLLEADYETVTIPGTPAGSRDVTALIATASRLEIHTVAGFVIVDPVDPAQRVYPPSTAGAISQSAVTLYEGKQMYYLAADLQLRTLSVARPADFASTVATSDFAALGALHYLRQHLDLDAIVRQPDRVWVFPDSVSQHIWMFLPGTDGALTGFAYDLMNKGIVGPFTYPKVYASAAMEPGRPEFVFADEAGRLFVWDTSAQMDSAANAFGTQAAFTANSTGTPMPARYNGFGSIDYDHDQNGSASRFYQAHEAVLETGLIDFGQPGRKKAFQAAIWRTVKDSRCFVEVSFITLSGDTETAIYGDVNDSTNCRASLMIPDTAARVKLRIIGAEMKKWAMRDLTLLWTLQGQV